MTNFNGKPTSAFARTIVVADDHQVVAEGVAHLLSGVANVVKLVRSGQQLLESLRRTEPDLVIAEISLPGLNGVETMELARAEGYAVPFLFLTMCQEPGRAAACMRAGAQGVIPKTAGREQLLQAIDVVMAGQKYLPKGHLASTVATVEVDGRKLTRTQLEVLKRIGRGLRAKEIAFQMGLSIRTVESHKYMIMQVLHVHGTLELIALARTEGLLEV